MRRLLRRLAWLIARLFLIMVLSFVVLAKATGSTTNGDRTYSTDRLEEAQLPTLFNGQPADLEHRVTAILGRAAKLALTASDQDELRRLGGATFPIILPRLASLPTDVRERLAWSLLPIARRMNWRGAAEIQSPAGAAEFFAVTWKERSVDFQSPMVQRWVERLAVRGGASLAATVAEYDTFALPALMASLPVPRSDPETDRARRLLAQSCRLTGFAWTIPEGATAADARRIVDHWQRWWRLHSIEYTVTRGPARVSAMLTQTGFGQWLALASRHRFGLTRDGRDVFDNLTAAGGQSLLLLVAGTIGLVLVDLHWRRRTANPRDSWRWRFAASLVGSIPPISAIALLSMFELAHGLAAAAIATCIAMALVDLGSLDRIDFDRVSTHETAPSHWHLRQLPSWLFAGHTWPYLLTLVFVIEKAFDVVGLGNACVNAFRHRDLHLLMGVTTITALWLLLIELVVQHNDSWRSERPAEEARK